MVDVHVAAGTDGGASGDAESIAKMTAVDYLTRLPPQEEAGIELMVNLLRQAEDQSITLVVIASLKDVALLLRKELELCCQKLKEVVIMGGVESFTPGKAAEGVLLKPDSAHNNEFDRESSSFVYQTLQERGVPMAVVSRFAAYACQVPKTIFDQMADTGSRIGVHLRSTQRYAMEKLWQRASAPEGSGIRHGLPARCDRAWFLKTFCGGSEKLEGKAAPTADDSIWDFVQGFNMYDPLALCVSLPALSSFFRPVEFVVNGTVHRVYGVSPEDNGVVDGLLLRDWLVAGFLEGITQSQLDKEGPEQAEIRRLRAENAMLREALKAAELRAAQKS